MSQKFYFYKLNIYSAQSTQNFSRENVCESIKSLFKGGDPYASEMIEGYFENVSLDYLEIVAREVEKFIPDLDERLKYIFAPQKSTFFMVDDKVWLGIEQIIEQEIRNLLKKKTRSGITERLKKVSEISSDYALLSSLFESKLLFVNIF